MWSHATEVVPNRWVAEGEIGKELMIAGNPDEALLHFRRAAAINPDDALSQTGIALYDEQHGNPQDALAHYQAALRGYVLQPHDRAAVYQHMARAYHDLGDGTKAQECLDRAAELHDQ